MKKLGLFDIRGTLPKNTMLIIELTGLVVILALWSTVTALKLIPDTLLPSPWKVLLSFKELYIKDYIFMNILYSIKLNLLGYIEAVILALIFGFPIGLFPFFRGLFGRYIVASRFLPLTALVGVFIAWFGLHDLMKIEFLAFGILVYMLPVVIQRIDEVDVVHQHTAKTLAATKWQMICHVMLPSALAKISDDIRVLVAISWTYIIVAELQNRGWGIGALAYSAARQSRIDKVFAILVIIVLIGFIQDRLLMILDKKLFPYKYI